ncbi:MAG: hypothetical protein WCY53_04130 [Sphaerochaetaceae bacterium]
MRKVLATIIILLIATTAFAFDGFTDIFDSDDSFFETTSVEVKQQKLGLNGALSFNLEGMADTSGKEINTSINGGLNLDLNWKGSIVDAKATLDLIPKTDRTNMEWIDIFTTLSISTFFDWGRVEAGLLKKEWGSGDGIHVVDPLNAPDYRNGLVDDPLQMKMAEPMVMGTATLRDTSIDVIYKPMLIPMVAAESEKSRWLMPSPINPADIYSKLTSFGVDESWDFKYQVNTPEADELAKLSHSQWGARVKTTLGPADLGIIYYNGFYTTPSFKIGNIQEIIESLTVNAADKKLKVEIDLAFTRAQLFGLEATVVTGPLTFMLEGGFWLSEDYKGNDPLKYNNKAVYLAGVGFTIPKTSAYLSFTYSGGYILNFVEDEPFNTTTYQIGDADYIQSLVSSNGKPYMNTLTAAFELPLAREKVNVRLGATYQIETKGYAIFPSVKWNLADDVQIKAVGRFFGTFDNFIPSMFNKWSKNDSLTVGISYLF